MDKKQIVNPGQKLLLEEKADLIREMVKGGSIYGLTVDLENEDIVLCAAFLLGRQTATQYAPYPRFGPSEYKKGDEVNGLPKV